MAKGMGFKKAAASVAKREGLPMARADAIIAAGARKASPGAVKKNPNLKKVSGVRPQKSSAGREIERRLGERDKRR